jgi:hypothetical protein
VGPRAILDAAVKGIPSPYSVAILTELCRLSVNNKMSGIKIICKGKCNTVVVVVVSANA